MGSLNNYRGVVQYVGTRYAGWQIQKNQRTVQGTLREAFQQVTGKAVTLVGAGRTDSGVHALAQVIHFRLPEGFSPARVLRAVNGVLPADIRVMRLALAPESFHAQRSAWKKRYEYRIYNGPIMSPFLQGLACQIYPDLEAGAMENAAGLLVGRHDFSAFAASGSRGGSRERTIHMSRIRKKGRRIVYQVEADGFLHHMVRNIVGTLLQVGLGKRSADEIVSILRSRDRRKAGPTAPAQGLYLVRIWY